MMLDSQAIYVEMTYMFGINDDGDNCIWELSPEKLHSIETYSIRFFTESAKTDYLGREHFLAVIPKDECNKIELKEE